MADLAVEANDGFFADLFDNAPCGYLVTTTEGTVTFANETYLGITGFARDEVIGRSFKSLLTVGSGLFYETRHLPTLRLRGRVDEVALSLASADRTSVPTLVNSVLVDKADGSQEIRIGVFNFTERRDYERELLASRRAAEQSEARVRILQQASSDFMAADSEQSLAEALVRSIRDALDATVTAVFNIDSNDELVLIAGTDPLRDLLPASARRPAHEAWRLEEIVTYSEALDTTETEYPGLAQALRSARLETLSAAPVIDSGTTLGVIVSYFGRQRELDDAAAELVSALNRQAAQVVARIRLQDQLTHLALHDQLTGLSNRKLLQERLGETLASSQRTARPVSVIFLDLDGFKDINDSCGHSTGDDVLQQVADRLRTGVRAGDTIGRYGGDEFVVVCDDADDEAATRVADRVQAAIREPLSGLAAGHPLSASIGIAVIGPGAAGDVPAESILRAADAAMYDSKNAGKNRISVVHV